MALSSKAINDYEDRSQAANFFVCEIKEMLAEIKRLRKRVYLAGKYLSIAERGTGKDFNVNNVEFLHLLIKEGIGKLK
jgi:hypothetical protein